MRGLKIGNQANPNKPGSRQKASLDPKDGSNSVNVKTYDVTSGTEGARTVKKGSPADKVSKEFGSEIDFGSSAPQTKPAGESKASNGTNRNTGATKSTYGKLSANFKGRAKDRNNKTVDFSNNNNDSRRGENFRLY
jgi:hypothetical protein